MPARRSARDSESLGIDAILLRMSANKSHGAVNVGDYLGNRKFRLAPMMHRKDGVPTFHRLRNERRDELLIERLVVGDPPAAHQENDARSVSIGRRLKHIQG